jgi:hypothetical protein
LFPKMARNSKSAFFVAMALCHAACSRRDLTGKLGLPELALLLSA